MSLNSIREIWNLSSLTALVNLWLNSNSLTSVPDLFNLTELKNLDLSGNEIATISMFDFNSLNKLESLHLSHNKIKSISGTFRLIYLKIVDLSENLIGNVDTAVFSALGSIERIYVKGNKLMEISTMIMAPTVTELWLQHNDISTISSDAFRMLYNLKVILLNDNRISKIFSFPYLPRLSILALDNNPLFYIANDTFLSIPKIATLSLRNTSITSLPSTIRNLRFIKTMRVSQNSLTRFPREIIPDTLHRITIDLQDNQIDHIDRNVLSELKNLRHLNILGNPIRAFDVTNSHPAKLDSLYMGSQATEFLSKSTLGYIQQLSCINLIGSPDLRIPSKILCSPTKKRIVLVGPTVDYWNGTCNVSAMLFPTLVDVVTSAPVLQLLLSHVSIASFSNITLIEGQSEVHPTYCANLRMLDYVNSGLCHIPTLFAPEMTNLNMSCNLLTTLRLSILTKYYPDLRRLDLSNNRIRVLSSCGVPNITHPLERLYLINNDLGRFSSWKGGNGFRVLLDLNELHLSGNDLSFLSKELVPSSLEETGRYGVTVHASDDPLVCSCQQRWLVGVDVTLKESKCSGPSGQVGRDLQDLIQEGFPCAPTMSRNIELCNTTKSATILVRCPVESFPHPQITWFLRDAGELITLNVTSKANLTSENDEMQRESHQLEIEIDHDPLEELESELTLMCRVVNDFGEIDILIEVRILWDANGESGNRNISVTCDAYQHEEECGTLRSAEFKTTSDSPLEQDKDEGYTNFSSRLCFSYAVLIVIFSCIVNLK